MKLPEDIFKYVRQDGSQIREEKKKLFPPDGPHNRQLACEIRVEGGKDGSIVCCTNNEGGKQRLNPFLWALLLWNAPVSRGAC